MTKSISEFIGKAGNIYVEKAAEGNDHPYEVWFEGLCILGDGDSEIEALKSAARHTADISALLQEAIAKTESAIGVGASAGELKT